MYLVYYSNGSVGDLQFAVSTSQPCAFGNESIGYTAPLFSSTNVYLSLVTVAPTPPFKFDPRVLKGSTIYVSIRGATPNSIGTPSIDWVMQ